MECDREARLDERARREEARYAADKDDYSRYLS